MPLGDSGNPSMDVHERILAVREVQFGQQHDPKTDPMAPGYFNEILERLAARTPTRVVFRIECAVVVGVALLRAVASLEGIPSRASQHVQVGSSPEPPLLR